MKTINMKIDPAEALALYRRLRSEDRLEPDAANRLAIEAAGRVIRDYIEDSIYSRDAVTLLCELSAHPDQRIARAGLTGIFPSLVERLNDSFDPAACRVYDSVFSQVIDFYRRHPDGTQLDNALDAFGIADQATMLDRKAKIGLPRPARDFTSVRKVMLLSRVTIGADVMINGTLIAKMRQLRPDAEFVLLGSTKLSELYGGDNRIRVHEIAYERGGTVLSRLLSWLDVIAAVSQETENFSPEEYILIDPDSRLTQLGLLPLLHDERSYLYFESRSWPGTGSLGLLASTWLGALTGRTDQAFPLIALPENYLAFGKQVSDVIRRNGTVRIVTISLGVGGNESKRVSDKFEENLADGQSNNGGLILDKGASPAERSQIDRLVMRLRASGKAVLELNEENLDETMRLEGISADVVTWDGGIGRFAGLIAASDQYIGYDSAGQHIAAALGTPCRTIFVSTNSDKFAERWRPYGRGEIEVESRK